MSCQKNIKRAFTLIELLVVIAIIAILAAILFPVFSRAKEAAKKTAAIAQMKQLALSTMMYAEDYDDFFLPSSQRDASGADPLVWPPLMQPYVKNQQIFIAPGSEGKYASNWANRKEQTVGYTDATGTTSDPATAGVPGAAAQGTEAFLTAANFSVAEESARTGLFVTTPGGTNKERGYVFNPYNGANSPDGDYYKGLPLIGDVNLCTTPYLGNDYTARGAGALKPVYARYQATGKGEGVSPVVFADGHCSVFTANTMNSFGKIIWRFR